MLENILVYYYTSEMQKDKCGCIGENVNHVLTVLKAMKVGSNCQAK